MKIFARFLSALGLAIILLSPVFADLAPADEQNRPAVRAALVEAKAELEKMRVVYTDQAPEIKGQQAKIAALEKQLTPLAAETKEAPAPAPIIIAVEFPGGSMAGLVATLGKINPGAFNVLGEESDLKVHLPAFS